MIVEITILSLAIVVLYIFFVQFQKNAFLNVLGPKAWPFVGNVLQMVSKDARPDQILERWARQYGNIYTIKVFNTPWLIVSGYDELHEMMVVKGKAFSGRYVWYRMSYIIFGDKDIGFGNPTQSQWMPIKKAAHRALQLRGDSLSRIETIILEMAGEFVAAIKKYKGRPVDIQNDIYNFVSKITLTLFTGERVDDNDIMLADIQKFEKNFNESFSLLNGMELDQFPWLRYFGHPAWAKLQETCYLREYIWEQLWNKSQKTYSTDKESSCILHTIAQMMDPKSEYFEPTMDTENARAMFFDFFFGGVSTTTNTSYYLINNLLHNPEVFRKLQQEADAVIGKERLPNISDRASMPYTCATIFEILRLHSILPVTSRKTLEDTTIGKLFIPAGTIVMGLLCALHHDEKFWGDPWTFRPERFINDNGHLLLPDHPNRKHLMPFGNGSRICVGELFALRRLFIFITTIVQVFDLQPGEKMVSCHPSSLVDNFLLAQKSYTAKFIQSRS